MFWRAEPHRPGRGGFRASGELPGGERREFGGPLVPVSVGGRRYYPGMQGRPFGQAHDPLGGAMMTTSAETVERAKARRRQELRRSNAAVPIPAAKYKRSRAWIKQQLRQQGR